MDEQQVINGMARRKLITTVQASTDQWIALIRQVDDFRRTHGFDPAHVWGAIHRGNYDAATASMSAAFNRLSLPWT